LHGLLNKMTTMVTLKAAKPLKNDALNLRVTHL
jgi:hypothetical protein